MDKIQFNQVTIDYPKGSNPDEVIKYYLSGCQMIDPKSLYYQFKIKKNKIDLRYIDNITQAKQTKEFLVHIKKTVMQILFLALFLGILISNQIVLKYHQIYLQKSIYHRNFERASAFYNREIQSEIKQIRKQNIGFVGLLSNINKFPLNIQYLTADINGYEIIGQIKSKDFKKYVDYLNMNRKLEVFNYDQGSDNFFIRILGLKYAK